MTSWAPENTIDRQIATQDETARSYCPQLCGLDQEAQRAQAHIACEKVSTILAATTNLGQVK